MKASRLIGLIVERPYGPPGGDSSTFSPGHACVYSGTLTRAGDFSSVTVDSVHGFQPPFPIANASRARRQEYAQKHGREPGFKEWFLDPQNALAALPVEPHPRIKSYIQSRRGQLVSGWEWGVDHSVAEQLQKAIGDHIRAASKLLDPRKKVFNPQTNPMYCLLVARPEFDNCLSWALAKLEAVLGSYRFPIPAAERYDIEMPRQLFEAMEATQHPLRAHFYWP